MTPHPLKRSSCKDFKRVYIISGGGAGGGEGWVNTCQGNCDLNLEICAHSVRRNSGPVEKESKIQFCEEIVVTCSRWS